MSVRGAGEIGPAVEHVAAYCLVGQIPEPALDHVQPGALGGAAVQLEARVPDLPGGDMRVLAGTSSSGSRAARPRAQTRLKLKVTSAEFGPQGSAREAEGSSQPEPPAESVDDGEICLLPHFRTPGIPSPRRIPPASVRAVVKLTRLTGWGEAAQRPARRPSSPPPAG